MYDRMKSFATNYFDPQEFILFRSNNVKNDHKSTLSKSQNSNHKIVEIQAKQMYTTANFHGLVTGTTIYIN